MPAARPLPGLLVDQLGNEQRNGTADPTVDHELVASGRRTTERRLEDAGWN